MLSLADLLLQRAMGGPLRRVCRMGRPWAPQHGGAFFPQGQSDWTRRVIGPLEREAETVWSQAGASPWLPREPDFYAPSTPVYDPAEVANRAMTDDELAALRRRLSRMPR